MKFQVVLLLTTLCFATFTLEWEDKFENLDNWYLINESGKDTGNKEWEYYTDRSVNVSVGQDEGQNALFIKARWEEYKGYHVTSGKLDSKKTVGPGSFVNIKAKVPKGNGLWPALWLLPPNARSKYGTWAACGEIDFMETVCTDNQGFGTLHYGGEWPDNKQGPSNNKYPVNPTWSEYNYFGVNYQNGRIQFWLNAQIKNGKITGGTLLEDIEGTHWYADNGSQRFASPAPFNTQFQIILNLAVGGTWPCSVSGCCENVALPAEMIIQHVEVYSGTDDADVFDLE